MFAKNLKQINNSEGNTPLLIGGKMNQNKEFIECYGQREFNFTNSSFLNKKEIKFIYDFIEYLENLGFKGGEL